MRRMTFIVFLIAFGAFSAPAQTGKDNADGRVEREAEKALLRKDKIIY